MKTVLLGVFEEIALKYGGAAQSHQPLEIDTHLGKIGNGEHQPADRNQQEHIQAAA